MNSENIYRKTICQLHQYLPNLKVRDTVTKAIKKLEEQEELAEMESEFDRAAGPLLIRMVNQNAEQALSNEDKARFIVNSLLLSKNFVGKGSDRFEFKGKFSRFEFLVKYQEDEFLMVSLIRLAHKNRLARVASYLFNALPSLNHNEEASDRRILAQNLKELYIHLNILWKNVNVDVTPSPSNSGSSLVA